MKLTENQEKWLSALESGDYVQGEGVLHNSEDDSFCCLGVACDLFFEGETEDTGAETHYIENNHVYDCTLPHSVAMSLNMKNRGGSFYEEEKIGEIYDTSLWSANDDGVSFKDIAAFIRAKPHLIFEDNK